MDGIHDCGGMDGLGPVAPPPDEPVFHEEWEKRMFALMISCFAGGHYVVDEFRHAIEKMDPADYLKTSYYEHWLHAVEHILVEKGMITEAELEARMRTIEESA